MQIRKMFDNKLVLISFKGKFMQPLQQVGKINANVDAENLREFIENAAVSTNPINRSRKAAFRKFAAENVVHQLALNQDKASEVDIVDVLCKYKGPFPVLEAAKANDLLAVKILLTNGAKPMQALEGAIQGKSLSLLKYLVEEVKVPISSLRGIRNSPYYGVLYQSIGWWEGFDYFISKGAVIPQDLLADVLYDPITPLRMGYRTDPFSIDDMRQLIKRGARGRLHPLNLGLHFGSGNSTLFSECFDSEKRIEIINIYVELGYSSQLHLDERYYILGSSGPGRDLPDWALDKGNITTPLWSSLFRQDLALTEALLKAGANPNVISPSNNQSSPLLFAREQGNRELIALLLKYGAKP